MNAAALTASSVRVACPMCGWNDSGRLRIVDRYLTDSPPVPRGDGKAFLELYLDDHLDPDSRVHLCAECGEELDPENVVKETK